MIHCSDESDAVCGDYVTTAQIASVNPSRPPHRRRSGSGPTTHATAMLAARTRSSEAGLRHDGDEPQARPPANRRRARSETCSRESSGSRPSATRRDGPIGQAAQSCARSSTAAATGRTVSGRNDTELGRDHHRPVVIRFGGASGQRAAPQSRPAPAGSNPCRRRRGKRGTHRGQCANRVAGSPSRRRSHPIEPRLEPGRRARRRTGPTGSTPTRMSSEATPSREGRRRAGEPEHGPRTSASAER